MVLKTLLPPISLSLPLSLSHTHTHTHTHTLIQFLNANIHKVTEKKKGVYPGSTFLGGEAASHTLFRRWRGHPAIWQSHCSGGPLPTSPTPAPTFLGKESCRDISIHLRCHPQAEAFEGKNFPRGSKPPGKEALGQR